MRRNLAVVAGLSASLLALGACSTTAEAPAVDSTEDSAPVENTATYWEGVLAEAQGQTVDWFMWGGDDRLNAYINGYVAEEAAKYGVTLNQVNADASDTVNKILGEKQAENLDDGSVDLVWINGENFATGKQADLWLCGWAQSLPSAEFVDWESDAIKFDFGTPVDDCEAPWNQAMSVITFDSSKVSSEDFSSVSAMVEWINANPGQFTYAAPPDFNGSMTVRRLFYDAVGGYDQLLGEFDQATYDELAPQAWEFLNGIEGNLWRGGATYPQAIDEVEKLFASGEISAYISYNAGRSGLLVADGVYPESTRSTSFGDGMIGNTNYVAIPFNSPDSAGAQVVANILQSPEAQLRKADPSVLGYYPAIEMDRTEFLAEYEALPVPESVLPFTQQKKNANSELSAAWLEAIEKGWIANVLQR
jgi:putative spermidine/putrescine transport system substrate-binding protein